MSKIVNVTDGSFNEDVLESDLPVLVDFWAEWCGPCKMIAPLLEEAATTFDSQVKVVKINLDENPETPAKYSIRSIPTLLLFRNGEVSATKVGALSGPQLSQFIEESIS